MSRFSVDLSIAFATSFATSCAPVALQTRRSTQHSVIAAVRCAESDVDQLALQEARAQSFGANIASGASGSLHALWMVHSSCTVQSDCDIPRLTEATAAFSSVLFAFDAQLSSPAHNNDIALCDSLPCAYAVPSRHHSKVALACALFVVALVLVVLDGAMAVCYHRRRQSAVSKEMRLMSNPLLDSSCSTRPKLQTSKKMAASESDRISGHQDKGTSRESPNPCRHCESPLHAANSHHQPPSPAATAFCCLRLAHPSASAWRILLPPSCSSWPLLVAPQPGGGRVTRSVAGRGCQCD